MTDPGSRRADLLIYVQHLLGVGHLSRAAAIARACAAAGLEVVLVSGGLPVAGLDPGRARLVQLPPVKSRDSDFSGLVDATGRPLVDSLKTARKSQLLECLTETGPKIVLIELYPFGRRQLRFELEPLVAAARARRPRPWLLCSLRDILNPMNPAKADWAVEQVRAAFDLVLVHGDRGLAPLETSFPQAPAIADRLRYTGYIVEPAPPQTAPEGEGTGEILVSTGGGAVGQALIEAALAARPLSPFAAAPWRILVGGNLPAAAFERARAAAPAGVTVERARPDFRSLLGRCRLSASQGGYNTLVEVLQAGVPAVVVPFASEGEREQTIRAEILAARGLLHHLPAEALSPQRLAEALAAARAPAAGSRDLDLGGAEKTAKIVRELLARPPD